MGLVGPEGERVIMVYDTYYVYTLDTFTFYTPRMFQFNLQIIILSFEP